MDQQSPRQRRLFPLIVYNNIIIISISHHHHRIINIRRWLSWHHYHFHCWLQSNEREMMMMVVVVHFRHATPPPPPQYIINKQQHELFRECTKCRQRYRRRNARRPTHSWKHFALPTDKIIKTEIPITWTRRNTSECVVVVQILALFNIIHRT